jgi:hypothetical protein
MSEDALTILHPVSRKHLTDKFIKEVIWMGLVFNWQARNDNK